LKKLPVVDKNNKLTGLLTYRDLMKLEDFPNSSKDHLGRLRVGAAVGIAAETHDRVDALVHVDVDLIIVDTAHGHSEGVLNMVREIRKRHRNIEIVGGNIATGAGAKALADAGVDGVKVGVGPGSICTTRIVAGVGVPQLSAVYGAAYALKGTGIPIIADGAFDTRVILSKQLQPGRIR
jgi:IMP dehydrogenase